MEFKIRNVVCLDMDKPHSLLYAQETIFTQREKIR